MIALLIGGAAVLCIGLLTIGFGVPIKEFSFGNTMIVAGTITSCTGVLLIGLYFVGRELKALARRLEAGIPAAAPVAGSREASDLVDVIRSGKATPDPLPPLPIGRAGRDEKPFSRDRARPTEDFADRLSTDPLHAQRMTQSEPAADNAASWQDDQNQSRNSAVADDTTEAASSSAQRQRRNLMFSSRRREQTPRDVEVRDESFPEQTSSPSSAEDTPAEEAGSRQSNPPPGSLFDTAWPQRERPRREPSPLRSRLTPRTSTPTETSEPEAPRERYQPPKRAETESVTVVKSGVVDSMAYSLYSDGSIEAQMPEGMVRFASIEELRTHLDQRG